MFLCKRLVLSYYFHIGVLVFFLLQRIIMVFGSLSPNVFLYMFVSSIPHAGGGRSYRLYSLLTSRRVRDLSKYQN